MRRSLSVLGLTSALFACTDSKEAASDSGGRVVEFSAELEAAPTVYAISPPTIVVGGLKENSEDEFNHRNGFLAAAAMSDGGLAVIDETKLRIFDRTGAQRAVLGKAGRGPGEVTMFSAVCVTRGDTIIAYDISLRRVSVVGPNGGELRQFPANELGSLPQSGGCMSDGTFILRKQDESPGGALGGAVSRVSTSGEVVTSLGSYPQMTPTVRVSAAAAGMRLFVADPRTREIVRVDSAGGRDLVLVLRERLRQMDEAEAARRAPVAVSRGSGSAQTGRNPDQDLTAPLYETMMVEGVSHLWIQRAKVDFREPSIWVRVDTAGHVLGKLEIPGFTGAGMPPLPTEFVDGGLWMLHRDQDGTATFEFHRLLNAGR